MSYFLYLAIEGRPGGTHSRWHFMQRMEDPGSTKALHEAFGTGTGDRSDALNPRGWPADVADETLAEGAYFVDDAIAATDAGDCVSSRFCTTTEAAAWVSSGQARRLSADRCTSPDVFGASWATTGELRSVLRGVDVREAAGAALAEIVETMGYLEEAGIEVRAVFWFE